MSISSFSASISQLVWTANYKPAEQNFAPNFMSLERFDYPCNPVKLDAILRDKGLGVGDVPRNCGLHEDIAAEVVVRGSRLQQFIESFPEYKIDPDYDPLWAA